MDVHRQLSFTSTTTRRIASDSESLTVNRGHSLCRKRPLRAKLQNNQLLLCVYFVTNID